MSHDLKGNFGSDCRPLCFQFLFKVLSAYLWFFTYTWEEDCLDALPPPSRPNSGIGELPVNSDWQCIALGFTFIALE